MADKMAACLSVCFCRHSNLVIYYPIASKISYMDYFYQTLAEVKYRLSPKLEYGLCQITKIATKVVPSVSLHLWIL